MEGIVFGFLGLLLGGAAAGLARAPARTPGARRRAGTAARDGRRLTRSLLEERLDVQKGAALRAEQELASARGGTAGALPPGTTWPSAEAVRLGGANAELTDQLRLARDEGAVSRANAEAAKVEVARDSHAA